MSRIGDVGESVGESQLHRFDEQVPGVGRAVAHAAQIEATGDIQRQESREPLAVWRDLVEGEAVTVSHGFRLDPFGAVVGQIVLRQWSSRRLNAVDDLPADLAQVEGVVSLLGQCLQGDCEFRITEQLARPGGAAARQPDAP
jgi:hypothetical protein